MTRILVVETGAGFGGALSSLETLLTRLDASRWEVHLLTGYPQELIKAGGAVRQVGILERARRYGSGAGLETALRPALGKLAGNAAFAIDHLTTGRGFARAVTDYVREHDIDIVQGNNGILINDAVILGAMHAGKPCVIHSRGAEYPSRVTGWLARGVSRVLAVSGYVADSVGALGVPLRRIVMTPEGLEADGFAHGADAQAFRQRHGLPPGLPLVGMVGCLVDWKGHDVFLEACAQVLPHTDAGAMIVGAEPDASGGMLARLREKARALGLADRVWFTGHETDVASAMAVCRVVVHASIAPEPFGRVLLEAMALGRAVVATRDGGPGEIIASGHDGLLVAAGDSRAMAEAIRLLLTDTRLRERLGGAGWEKVRNQYGMQDHITPIETVWRELAG